ncbi:hypothetical protein [Acidithiobacillus ferrivorans]|uniref:hypothetical protein n=1 Tax=Acidithiobacillus ferrivorans TaxID=160808 RepID=UPI001ED93FB8|nr:hypothetical protein [Acidithiobacillus ferrivorans]
MDSEHSTRFANVATLGNTGSARLRVFAQLTSCASTKRALMGTSDAAFRTACIAPTIAIGMTYGFPAIDTARVL